MKRLGYSCGIRKHSLVPNTTDIIPSVLETLFQRSGIRSFSVSGEKKSWKEVMGSLYKNSSVLNQSSFAQWDSDACGVVADNNTITKITEVCQVDKLEEEKECYVAERAICALSSNALGDRSH